MYTLYDVAAVEEHASDVLRVDRAREVRVAEMPTVRHRYFLTAHKHKHIDRLIDSRSAAKQFVCPSILAREGQRGEIAKKPKIHLKFAPNFCPESCSGGLYSGHSGARSSPPHPKRSAHSKTHSWLSLCHLHHACC